MPASIISRATGRLSETRKAPQTMPMPVPSLVVAERANHAAAWDLARGPVAVGTAKKVGGQTRVHVFSVGGAKKVGGSSRNDARMSRKHLTIRRSRPIASAL